MPSDLLDLRERIETLEAWMERFHGQDERPSTTEAKATLEYLSHLLPTELLKYPREVRSAVLRYASSKEKDTDHADLSAARCEAGLRTALEQIYEISRDSTVRLLAREALAKGKSS